jgi:hypothetical protein
MDQKLVIWIAVDGREWPPVKRFSRIGEVYKYTSKNR